MKRSGASHMKILALEFSSSQRSVAVFEAAASGVPGELAEVIETGGLSTKPFAMIDEVLREKNWLEQEFGMKIDAVSFHQPTRTILDAQINIPGLVNTYNAAQMAPYFYVSDTNMTWRHEHPLEIFSRGLHERLQLLIHPMWWTPEPLSTLDKWQAVLRNNQKAVINHWRLRERTLASLDFHLKG